MVCPSSWIVVAMKGSGSEIIIFYLHKIMIWITLFYSNRVQ